MISADDAPPSPTLTAALLGVGVLALTVAFSDFPQLVQNPERFFDVPAPTPLLRALHGLGFFLQLAAGLWLSFCLVFDIRRARRAAAVLWPVSVALYFAPFPNARQDLALAPALFVGAVALTALSWAVNRATRQSV